MLSEDHWLLTRNPNQHTESISLTPKVVLMFEALCMSCGGIFSAKYPEFYLETHNASGGSGCEGTQTSGLPVGLIHANVIIDEKRWNFQSCVKTI